MLGRASPGSPRLLSPSLSPLSPQVEDAEEKPAKTTEKTVWDWELMNDNKPIWTRKPAEVEDDEYSQFYRSLTKDESPPLAK
jgi:heat shock protein 90kDa beta